ncbi:LLM class flavin-dependent oxidoreductase [Mycobacterium sp. Marseille-P9652]|uniref:LLM class flavin-dependent oxidoreductase n=1 Tax=Mycobacterium sp. Marseille-P9652 TaxID=2654950 RepID=UPI0012E9614B|nr:LLM class flavin-dependent oxidoreductase [Mycobacterium sp. Marseille-P9652]
MLTLRFDMRSPRWGPPTRDLYAAAIDMCAWAEPRGAVLVVLSEHHATEDGHLPAPTILASAIAARTTNLAILLAAVPLPLWDPVRLAEQINVLDLVSNGRVSYAFGVGHREAEYAHFGVDWAARGRLADENLAAVRSLVVGEPFDYRGRRVCVTPSCGSRKGPPMVIAGGSAAAARRAAQHGMGLIAQADVPGLAETYETLCRAQGREPGFVQFPIAGAPTTVFVTDDVDHAWQELGPHLLHDAVTAASYRHGDDSVASITRATTVSELREFDGPYRIMTLDEAEAYVRDGRPLPLHPLCGGVAPEVAWRYLTLAADAVDSAQRPVTKTAG